MTGRVVLKAGHVRPVWAGHPWVFAQAIARVEGGAGPGDEVEVVDPQGQFLGRGLYSPSSALVVRLFTRTASTSLDLPLLETRLRAAHQRRQAAGLPSEDTSGYRLFNADGDGLPGLVVDRFGSTLVVQFGTLGMYQRAQLVVEVLRRVIHPDTILDRTTAQSAQREGFTPGELVLEGAAPSRLEFRERGLQFRLPLALAQKTGFYFDQRALRARIEALAAGRRVLDTYCFVGPVALSAARGGASEVVAVDSSVPALEVAAEQAELNRLSSRVQWQRGDALEALTRAGRKGGYELVVCDPPKWARGRGTQQKALAAYRRLAAAGARAVTPGGLLVLCSCSAVIGHPELTRALALGCRDVGLQATLLEHHAQGFDHPALAALPESLYLTSVVAEIHPLC